MLIVPDRMLVAMEAFVVKLFTGEMRDPEELSKALQSLAMMALPGAIYARKVRQQYRREREPETLFGDDGWADRQNPGEIIPFARRDSEETSTGG